MELIRRRYWLRREDSLEVTIAKWIKQIQLMSLRTLIITSDILFVQGLLLTHGLPAKINAILYLAWTLLSVGIFIQQTFRYYGNLRRLRAHPGFQNWITIDDNHTRSLFNDGSHHDSSEG